MFELKENHKIFTADYLLDKWSIISCLKENAKEFLGYIEKAILEIEVKLY
jgi:hypothetical protein